MTQIAAGDRQAFAAIFDLHSPVVLGVLVKMLGRRELAEETLQEVFLQAWRKIDQYNARRASPLGWLIMIARSRAIDLLRSSGARDRREEAIQHDPNSKIVEAPQGTARLEQAEDQHRVHSALTVLPEKQRRCIELAFYEGLTQSQIATRLDEPLGTVKSRILLGMRKLRVALENNQWEGAHGH